MTIKNWNFEELKNLLANKTNIHGWIFDKRKVRRRERYFLADNSQLAVDQDRDVTSTECSIQLFIRSARVGFQSEITAQLYPSLPLAAQIDQAIKSAAQTEFKAWSLPAAVSTALPKYLSADSRITEDLEGALRSLTAEITKAVAKTRRSQFNSSELFVSYQECDTYLSNGMQYSSASTQIYLEAAYSMTAALPDGRSEANEFMSTRWSVNLENLKVEEFFDEVATKAEVSTNCRAPISGLYPVIINHEALSALLDSHVTQLSAASLYLGLPTIKSGEEFVQGAHGGDLVNLRMDPSLPYGASTIAVNEGVAQYPLELVKNNVVVSNYCSKRYSDYLGIALTTTCGNWVLECGSASYSQLCQAAPQVIEILQFSAINPDSATGTFSSEIRLAKLYDNTKGTVTYLKGGSLSGSMKDNFSKVRFSRESATRSHFDYGSSAVGYQGPAFALLNDVSIVG